MFPNSSTNSPKTNSQLHHFVQQQSNQQHQKKPSNPADPMKKKQNLINQLQNNQQKSMLYRLHQQHQMSETHFGEMKQEPYNYQYNTYVSTQPGLKQPSMVVNQISDSSKNSGTPIKPQRMPITQQNSPGNQIRTSMQPIKQQQAYNHNRLGKTQTNENFHLSQAQSNSFYNAPPIHSMGQVNQQQTKFQNTGNRPLGSQERLTNAHQSSGYGYKPVGKRPINMSNAHMQSFKSGSTDNLNQPTNLNYQAESNIMTTVSNHQNPQITQQVFQNVAKGQVVTNQHPHFIKVKSKTKANPTRQNSPRFSGQFSIHQGKNQIRDSTNSQNKKQQLGKNGLQRAQVFSQPSSPAKEQLIITAQNIDAKRTGYTSSYVEPNIMGQTATQFNQRILDQDIKQNMLNIEDIENQDSLDTGHQVTQERISVPTAQSSYKGSKVKSYKATQQSIDRDNHPDAITKRLKGNSSQNLYQSISGLPSSATSKTTKGSMKTTTAQNSKLVNKRVQSGTSSKNQQSFQSAIRRLNSPQNNISQQQPQFIPTQLQKQHDQKKQLNHVVAQKIGGIASGNSRRENRNQMMKNNQQKQVFNSKSLVGSMGSMGSLGRFIGVEHVGKEEEYNNTMKYAIEKNQTSESIKQQQQFQASQLQQMHLNNLNPMFFSTGEVIPQQNVMNASGQVSINQNLEQYAPDGQTNDPRAYTEWTQNEQEVIQGKPVQVKASMIQMRKINPISKTTTGSKNTSIERKKSLSNTTNVGQPIKKADKHQSNYQMIGNMKAMQQKRGIGMAQTTKPSANNSPRKANDMSIGGQIGSNSLIKRQQQMNKQQPIGQPMGDIPLMTQYYSQKSKQQELELKRDDQQKKHFAQSVLIRENSKKGQIRSNDPNSTQNKDNTKFKTLYHQDAVRYSKPINEDGPPQNIIQQTPHYMGAGGKLKLKVKPESISPPHFQSEIMHANIGEPLKNSFQNQQVQMVGGQQFLNQYFKQKKKNNQYQQLDSPKDSSIERARNDDIVMQESQISSQRQGKNNERIYIADNVQEQIGSKSGSEGNQLPNRTGSRRNIQTQKPTPSHYSTQQSKVSSQKQSFAIQSNISHEQKSNIVTQYIIQNVENTQVQKLSPRSKEVCLIKQLIQDCFGKYNKPPKTQLELYKIGKMLGKGAFGKVNLGLHRLTRKLVAIKSINMDFMKEESQKKKIMNEINILKSLRHPNNIKILETFQTEKHHMIVMELCPGGDLLNYVRKRRKLTEKYAKFVFKQIMKGIAYLHANKVAHRDIKLDNILLDGHGNIKLGDFGVSRKIDENEILFEQCGTPAYIAPEIVKDMGYKGFPVDIWSAGICLYAMLYGNVPFKANQIGDLNMIEQLNQEIEYKKDIVSNEAINLMKIMLQKSPKQRATAEQVLDHEWLNSNDEHIDIFDEQELELIRKEFTYVVQKKKLKELKDLKEKALFSDMPCEQYSRQADDLNTEFTECSIQTHENSLLKNDSTRSVILCPFNTQTGDKNADKIIAQSAGLMQDKDLMIRFHQRVREIDRNYEKMNNQDFDNGVYHKYAYKQKGQKKEDQKDNKEDIKEEEIRQSDVKMNNLVSEQDTNRKRKREDADFNYHNYYVKINQNIIKDTVRLGFPLPYLQKCLKENANNHCTTTYYLLCMDQNF